MRSVDSISITNKTILLRADFNVTLDAKRHIADDYRIRQTIPTIQYLLKNHNRIILVSHLGDPGGKKDMKYSLAPVVQDLHTYIPNYQIHLVEEFESVKNWKWQDTDILMLENIRFHEGEEKNDPVFAQQLASAADVYVNDAFGVSHRKHASVYGVAKLLPSYSGLLLQKEIMMIDSAIKNPMHPLVAILGGAKVSTKIHLIEKLMEIADILLVGGGLANTFFAAQGFHMGNSFYEKDAKKIAEKLLRLSKSKKTTLILPVDVVMGDSHSEEGDSEVVKPEEMIPSEKRAILDIGPETQAAWGNYIAQAETIIWNGPVGYIEHPVFSRGTDFVYYSIAQNNHATSVLGGGETLAAISQKEYLDHITHISTGGGAMLEYIEKGTLPGIEALDAEINSA